MSRALTPKINSTFRDTSDVNSIIFQVEKKQQPWIHLMLFAAFGLYCESFESLKSSVLRGQKKLGMGKLL